MFLLIGHGVVDYTHKFITKCIACFSHRKREVGKDSGMTSVPFGSSHGIADSNGLEQSLDEEFGIQDVRTLDVRKSHETARTPNSGPRPRRLGRVRNLVQQLTYNGYVTHHYTYMSKVMQDVESTSYEDAIGNVHW